jgi:hypothetical protein
MTLTDDELGECFSTDRFLANAAIVFDRLEALEI